MPSDVIDYRLIGDDLQAVIVTLDPNEAVIAEAGAMMYMQDGIRMATTLDTTGSQKGLFSSLLHSKPTKAHKKNPVEEAQPGIH
jgi:uncharacterized protein (AIM24 family)